MARHKDADWKLPGPNLENWQQAEITVLMDVRDELKELNRHMREQTEILRGIRRITAWSRKKRESQTS